ncbi:hypothetical protein [Burkholderia gladioli]|uniref:hypothetical protein n=1 Tax=Burkholderia gladioli TaxID=28095 RepID=UPI00163EC73F|nr:hypothetical protein [Burkholderia gladioli]
MNEQVIRQLFAEMLDAQEQAFALLALSVGDVVGKGALSAALETRIEAARSAQSHPIRDRMLAIARAGLKQPD